MLAIFGDLEKKNDIYLLFIAFLAVSLKVRCLQIWKKTGTDAAGLFHAHPYGIKAFKIYQHCLVPFFLFR